MDKFIAHILVVDDDDGIRSLVKQYLNENKFLVTTADSAEDASENEGIGLKNLENRLNLLYPNTHKLCATMEENSYSTTLEIYKK